MSIRTAVPAVVILGLIFFTSCNSTNDHTGNNNKTAGRDNTTLFDKQTAENLSAKPTGNKTVAASQLEKDGKDLVVQTSYHEPSAGSGDPVETPWQKFRKEFKTVDLPLTINHSTRTNINTKKRISYNFKSFAAELKSERFSRDVGKECFYYAVVAENENFTTLVYGVRNWVNSVKAPIKYVMATYDNKGKIIDRQDIAGHLYPDEPDLACTIKSNLAIEVKSYNNIYKENPENNGYEQNPIIRQELQSTEHFKITSHGKIVKTSGGVAMN